MSLDNSKLENVRMRGDQSKTARCPACAESGKDHSGNHLVVYPDGCFACVVYRGDSPDAKVHRKRIFALCGSRDVRPLVVRPVKLEAAEPIKTGVLGRLGRVFQSHSEPQNASNGVPVENLSDCETGVLSVLKNMAGVMPYRPLTELEHNILRRAGMESDPLIITALNLFNGQIVECSR